MTDPIPLHQLLLSRRMIACAFLGFSSGLPLFVLTHTLPAWFHDFDVDVKVVAGFALTQMPYAWKFLWSPVLDRFVPPLGRRRGWALLSQLAVIAVIASFSLLSPSASLATIGALAVLLAVVSATQDIALDAWRREMLPDHEQGMAAAVWINAYRLAMLVPGSLALILADRLPWATVFLSVAAAGGVGLLGTAIAPPPLSVAPPPASLREAVIGPFVEFFGRGGGRAATGILSFAVLYSLGDATASQLFTVYWLDLGFTKTQVGEIAKVVQLWAAVLGGFVGGALITRHGIRRTLLWFGAMRALAMIGFASLAVVGPNPWALATAVGFEYLAGGLCTSAFAAFLAQATSRRFSATQYALLSSLMALPRTLAGASAGMLQEIVGWPAFFLCCGALALPGLWLSQRVPLDEPAKP